MSEEKNKVAAELDAEHLRAKAGFQAKGQEAYMSIFASNLAYKQPDGRVIGKEELARDVESQLASGESSTSA